MSMFHEGNRELQDAFGSRALADRLDERLRHDRFTDADAAFIQGQPFFFLATADAQGRPDCSFKGGAPGFARIVAPDLLVFPDYDGNGMFKSLGNIRSNPHVGLLFIAMGEKAGRLRVNGAAEVVAEDPLMAAIPGAQLLVKVTPVDIFPNCPRYIPQMALQAASSDAPQAGQVPVEPKWKSFPDFADVVPPRRA
ncbi:MAG: pyridoxamine 5'-phosphate oxidase family protein [Phenylobacterium sp.]|uniref:pyridoxamine 5'-phosphate oxidase family protein n=1 Tax=Phenylobacterium sp. TaxID=1871053 RepID=UPI001A389F52|nr:pyridoxamine 5'-phosphate oxidase family protein [Phenylobacterium sp.]MBL8773282.1 pyridoxamine 5'-phosphate oxidase family protein [Phenylobacterium sp.]